MPHRSRSIVDPVAADLVPAFASGSASQGGSGRRSGSLQRSLSRLEEGGYSSRTVPEDAFVHTLGVRLASSAAVTSNVGQVALLQPTHVNTAASVSPFATRGGGGSGVVGSSSLGRFSGSLGGGGGGGGGSGGGLSGSFGSLGL